MADPDDWLIPHHVPTSRESRTERERALQGLTELGIDHNSPCPICLVNFNVDPEDPEVDNRYKISMSNRLYSCGCKGTGNRHIFHQYCLANYCCKELRRTGRRNVVYIWDEQGVPCPLCRQPMGIRRNGELIHINLIGPEMDNRPTPSGGTKRRKLRRRTRRR